MNRILLLLFLITFSAVAQVPPVLRNPFSTNNPPGTVIFGTTLIISNNTAGNGGWVQIDSTGFKVFDLKGQEAGRIYLNSGIIAMEYGAGFSGFFTNGTGVIHTRDGTKVPLTVEGDTTSQTTFLIGAYTNSGTPSYTFTVNSDGTIYSKSLLSWRQLYTDGNTNIVSATSAALSYLANTQQINFASTPYQSFQMTNDTVFTNQNQQANRSVAVKMIGNTTNCALSFPSGWVFLGSPAPSSLSASKVAVLSLTASGSDPTNIVAVYAVQP